MNAPPLVIRGIRDGRGGPPAAIAIAGGVIVALGPDSELAARLTPATRVLDAAGVSVTPALTDAHVHFVPWAMARRQLDLDGVRSRGEALDAVRDALRREPGEAPLVGRGWDASDWREPPVGPELDALAPERPVLLHRHDLHTLWVNGAALRAAGISRETPDPPGGRFERDASGRPSGVVRETAVRAFASLESAAGPEVTDGLLDEAAAALHATGVVAVHDFERTPAAFRRMRALAVRRRLRVVQQIGPEQLDGAMAVGLESGVGDDWFRVGALKLFADGTLGSRTAAMLEPFADRGGLGMDVTPADALRATVARAVAGRFAVSVHAIGDRAVRHALDAFEAVRPRLPDLALPCRIEHVQLVAPADLPRFAALGVAASMQPQHAVTDAAAALAAWGDRCRHAYAWRSLLASGAALAFGSDAPVEPPLVGEGLAAAVTRQRADGTPSGGFVPGERIGLAEALAAYTEGPARLAGAAGRLGRLAPGARADLVVWNADLGALSGGALRGAKPVATVLDGEIVYESPSIGRSTPGTGASVAAGRGIPGQRSR